MQTMRTAVLITGQDRSLPRTITLLRRNLLEPNNVTLFFASEFTPTFDGIEIGGAEVRDSFRNPEFNAFISMLWCSGRRALVQSVFDRTTEGWSIDYVFSSGTVLQYYQIWRAWLLVLDYEQKHKMKFDIVVRLRPDSLITEKLDLSAIFSPDELTCRSLGNERIRRSLKPTGGSTEKAVVTLGAEQFWVAKRDVFALLGPMVFTYGSWDSGTLFAFNSECFFSEFCKMNHLNYYPFSEGNLFNTNHPGTHEVLDDPLVFSLLR